MLKGIIYTVLWYLSIWTGFLFVCCPLWVFILFVPKVFVPVMSVAFSVWEMYPVALMNLIFNTKIRITGDRINAKEVSIIIVNHRTRVDWNFLWALMYYGCQPRCHKMKISLKAPVRHMPSLGWVMQVANCIFLKRKWEKDKIIMNSQLKYFDDIGQVFQMLLFPEGTDLTESNILRSNEYAMKNDFDYYTHVLHPKTTGFIYLVNTMRKMKLGLAAVYDLTLAYSDCVPQTEMDIIRGNFPTTVNFHVNRYSISDLPTESDKLKLWINTRWREKEERLVSFKNDKVFLGPSVTSDMENALHLAFFFWTVLLLAMIYLFVTSFVFFWWTIVHVSLFVGISYGTDGFQKLCVFMHEFKSNAKMHPHLISSQ